MTTFDYSGSCDMLSSLRVKLQRADQLLPVIQSRGELCFLLILALSLRFSSVVSVQAEAQPPPSKDPSLPLSAGPRKRQEEEDGKQRDLTTLHTPVTDVTKPLSPAALPCAAAPPAAQTPKVEAEFEKQGVEERVEEEVEVGERNVNVEPRKKPLWMDDDDLPPMMWDSGWTLPACVFITALLKCYSAFQAYRDSFASDLRAEVEDWPSRFDCFSCNVGYSRCPLWHVECDPATRLLSPLFPFVHFILLLF